MIGRTIGTYRIESLLGQGGMGAVYRGVDTMLERPVAVKALRADIAASPQHVERFRQEARTLARLLDPHIATLYALLRDGDDLYMVMEFVEGETFEALLHRERRLPSARALALFDQALQGIDHAHRRGIVHRDVKPANFMRTPDGTVKVMDFGIARLLGTARMTQTRHSIGTAEYMAPEQVRARDVDARTDVYALGVLLYELVTGRVPFEAASSFETMQAHLQTAPRPPSRWVPDLPPMLEAAILTALAKEPADRFASVADFRSALAEVAVGAPPSTAERRIPKRRRPSRPAPPTVAAPHRDAATEPVPEAERVVEADGLTDPMHDEPGEPGTAMGDALEPDAKDGEPDDPTRDPRPPVGPTVVAPVLATAPPTVLGPSPNTAPPTALGPSPDRPATSTTTTHEPPPAPLRSLASTRLSLLVAGVALVVALGMWTMRPDPPAGVPSPPAVAAEGVDASPGSELVAGAVGAPMVPQSPPAGQPMPPTDGSATPVTVSPPANPARSEEPIRRDEPIRRPEPNPERTPQPTPRRTDPSPRPEPPPPPPPQARTGTARVLVRPFGDVYIDGRRLGRETNAPVTAELAPGTYTVRATHPTFGEITQAVRVRAGETAEVRLQFDTPVDVTVTSDPLNAEILVDGRPTGRYTPATVSVDPGTHTITVERDGFPDASRSITLSSGQRPATIHFTLTP